MKTFTKRTRIMTLSVLVLLAALSTAFTGCSHGSGGSDDESTTTLVTRYAYILNADSSYHRVYKYVATDNGDNTFEVKSSSIHYLSISNSNYTNRTGSELCAMIRTNAVKPSSSEESTFTEDKDTTITNTKSPTGVDTFHHYKGEKYTVYYYF